MKNHPRRDSAPNLKQITYYSLKIYSQKHVDELAKNDLYWQEFLYFMLVYALASPFVEMEALPR